MCVGGNSIEIDDSMMSGRRDTSNELIKSKYALSEENKKRNKDIISARNRAKSLVAFNTSGDNGSTGDGVPFSGGSFSSTPSSGRGTADDAYGGMGRA